MSSKFSISLFLLLLAIVLLGMAFVPNQASDQQASPTATLVPVDMPLAEWVAFIRPTDDCPLPCWWGIIPGQTTLSEAQDILISQFEGVRRREPYHISEHKTQVSLVGVRRNLDDSVDGWPIYIRIYAMDDVVNLIQLFGGDSSYSPEEGFHAWDYFSPLNLIATYGTPDSILLFGGEIDEVFYAREVILHWFLIKVFVMAGLMIDFITITDFLAENVFVPLIGQSNSQFGVAVSMSFTIAVLV